MKKTVVAFHVGGAGVAPAVAATPRGTSAAAVITVVSATARFLPRWCRTTLMASILWRGRHHSGGGGRPGAHTGSGEDQESSDPPHSQYVRLPAPARPPFAPALCPRCPVTPPRPRPCPAQPAACSPRPPAPAVSPTPRPGRESPGHRSISR